MLIVGLYLKSLSGDCKIFDLRINICSIFVKNIIALHFAIGRSYIFQGLKMSNQAYPIQFVHSRQELENKIPTLKLRSEFIVNIASLVLFFPRFVHI